MAPQRSYNSKGSDFFVIGDLVCTPETKLFKGVKTVVGFNPTNVNLGRHYNDTHPAHLWLCAEDGDPIEAFCPKSNWYKYNWNPDALKHDDDDYYDDY